MIENAPPELGSARIAVIGLGYVGLPLAVAFANRYPTLGYDLDAGRIDALRGGVDRTREVSTAELAQATALRFTAVAADLASANVYVVTVPTPIDAARSPDFGPLQAATARVAAVLAAGDVVIYESTVYPGATEEICIPALERGSGLRCDHDFHVGYSPERINSGDAARRLGGIVKVTSGSSTRAADFVDALYRSIIEAGTHRTSSIRVAEAAKVIENTQRDVNIALVNELALIFAKLGLDTLEVLEAAGTKWNFLPFRPGLVGGHCISVDPYYLTHKAQQVGHHPEVILAGRRINDGMGEHVAHQVIRLMTQRRINPAGAAVLVLGLSFKENCPDIRNTRVVDIIRVLGEFGACVHVHDPWVDPADARREHGLELVQSPERGAYDAIVVAVAHREFAAGGGAGIRGYARAGGIVYDVKHVLPRELVDGRL